MMCLNVHSMKPSLEDFLKNSMLISVALHNLPNLLELLHNLPNFVELLDDYLSHLQLISILLLRSPQKGLCILVPRWRCCNPTLLSELSEFSLPLLTEVVQQQIMYDSIISVSNQTWYVISKCCFLGFKQYHCLQAATHRQQVKAQIRHSS